MHTPPAYKRILLKISGESLLGSREHGISYDAAEAIAGELKEIRELGVEIALVVGGGNIFRGMAASKNGFERTTADYMGMLATVMNSLALQNALEEAGVPTRVQSALDMPKVCEPYIRRRAMRHMEKGRVVILAAGTGNPYVTTDSGAALRAIELGCDILMKATKVDGVYDNDPKEHSNANRFERIGYLDVLNSEAIQVIDASGITLCMENSMPILVFDLFKPDNLAKAIRGEKVGTIIGK
jgi:uridylate kinase